jgi:hypothetical protein
MPMPKKEGYDIFSFWLCKISQFQTPPNPLRQFTQIVLMPIEMLLNARLRPFNMRLTAYNCLDYQEH